MSAKEKLLKNILVFSIGNFGSRFLVFLLVPLFSFYLTPSQMGFYDMIVVTVGLCIPIASMQLSESIYRWLLDSDILELKKVLTSSFLTLLCSTIIGLLLFYLGTFFFPLEFRAYVGVYFIVMCFYPFFLAVARGMKMNKIYAFSGIINSGMLVILNWILLSYFSFGIKALFISNIVANIVSILILIYGTKFFKYISIGYFCKKIVKEFIYYSLPLIPNAISWWFINSVSRYIILYYLGQQSNGIYALSSRLAMALYAVNSIFNLAWQESAITQFNKSNRDKLYSDIFNNYFVIEMTLIIILMPLTKIYVLNFVGPAYADSWKYIPVLFLGVGFSTFASFFATGYLSSKKTLGAFTTTIFGAIINVAVALLLVPRIGLQGASIGIAFGFLITLILRIRQTRSYFNIFFDLKKISIISALTLIALFSVFSLNNIISLLFLLVLSMVLFIVANKFLLKKVFGKVAGKLKNRNQ